MFRAFRYRIIIFCCRFIGQQDCLISRLIQNRDQQGNLSFNSPIAHFPNEDRNVNGFRIKDIHESLLGKKIFYFYRQQHEQMSKFIGYPVRNAFLTIPISIVKKRPPHYLDVVQQGVKHQGTVLCLIEYTVETFL